MKKYLCLFLTHNWKVERINKELNVKWYSCDRCNKMKVDY